MKQSIKLIILLLVLVAGYAAYSLMSFAPDEPYEFVFSEPVLPPEILAQQADQENRHLNDAELAKINQAVAVIQGAIDQYQDYETKLPQQASSTLSVLNGYFFSGALPTHFLGDVDKISGKRKFGMLSFSADAVMMAESGRKNISCVEDNRGTETLIGSEDDNVIECDSLGQPSGVIGDRLILAGPGNDTITDTFGNRIINGGSGDDTIALGPGRSIIILEDGWGKDQLTVDCGDAGVSSAQIPLEFPVPWVYKYTNFIVLSPRLDPKDVIWDGLVLRNQSSGDSLTVNQNCFTVVPVKSASSSSSAP